MPKFNYHAKQGPAQVIKGVIEAVNMDKAVQAIIKAGLTPLDVREMSAEDLQKQLQTSRASVEQSKSRRAFLPRVGLKDLTLFTRQASDLIDASVPILRGLQVLSRQTPNFHLKKIIEEMHSFIRDGGAFSDALAQYPRIFSPLYVNMVRVGEVSGQLDRVLNRLASYLENEELTRSKVYSAMAYPGLIMGVGIITVFVLMAFIFPRIAVMFEDFDQQLPWPTVFVTQISNVFARFWWLIAGGLAAAVVYFKRWINTPHGGLVFDRFVLKMPLMGEFIKTIEIGRFCRTLATLLQSGVTISTALTTIAPTVRNRILQNEIRIICDDVKGGSGLRKSLGKCKSFPDMAVNMISVAEETGNLERGLEKVAETYDRYSDQAVRTLLSVLGPVLLILIFLVIGFVVIAMLLPIFQMNTLIQ